MGSGAFTVTAVFMMMVMVMMVRGSMMGLIVVMFMAVTMSTMVNTITAAVRT